MPKVDQKLSNNPATLLLPKRPSASKPPADQSFEHALKRAQPKPEAAPRQRAESPKPAQDDAPAAQADQPATATVDEQPVEAVAAPVEAEAPAEDQPVERVQKKVAAVEVVDSPVLPKAPDLAHVAQFVDLAPAVPLETDAPELPADPTLAPVDAPPPLRVQELPEYVTPPEPPDQPESIEPAEKPSPLATGYAVPQIVSDEVATDEMPDPVQKPAAASPLKQVVATATPRAESTVLPDASPEAVAPVDPIESDEPAVDDGAVKSETPKLKLAQDSSDSEADEEGVPQQAPTTPEATAVKDPSQHAAATPRMIDAPEVKAPVEAKPVQFAPPPPPPAPVRSDADFAATNHDRIVSSVRSQLLPNGGTMHLRLDPPELGALQIHVRMVDGVMQASFETSNDQATRLLSHTLSQLKNALETQGVSVDRLHVQQAPRDQQSGSSTEDQQRQTEQQDSQAQREQQRRELLNRMWRRIRLGRDPLDMVA